MPPNIWEIEQNQPCCNGRDIYSGVLQYIYIDAGVQAQQQAWQRKGQGVGKEIKQNQSADDATVSAVPVARVCTSQ